MKYPWMPLFWGDFLANTMHLSAQEAGAYLFLIAHAWEHEGEIPTEPVRLARIAHVRQDQWKKVWPALENFFERNRGGLSIGRPTDQWYTHRRVTDELRRLGKISNERKAAAMQMHRKSTRFAYANGGAKGMLTTSRSKTESSSYEKGMQPRAKPTQEDYRDKGPDYRAPPAKKSDNVLQPVPEKQRSR
jgi:uncharacterized protein YdaU (DUF1376 family)